MRKHTNIALFVPHAGCPHKCSFCNQKIISGQTKPLMPCDVDTACETALRTGGRGGEIAFFGGSFTCIERGYMLSLLTAAYRHIENGEFSGIRISTRPDAIDEEILTVLKKYGVSAIELGAQSMRDDVLEKNERGHTADDCRRAARLIKEHGFELGLQMMTGLYGDTDDGTVYTAEEFIKLSPDTVRIYPTTVLENTRLAELLKSGEYRAQTLDEAVSLCAVLLKMFYEKDIPVIRLGLHSGGGVEEGYIAGAYHPAFRELCESKIYRQLISDALSGKPCGKYDVFAAEPELSKVIGQKKENIEYFRRLGYDIKIISRKDTEKYKIQTEEIQCT